LTGWDVVWTCWPLQNKPIDLLDSRFSRYFQLSCPVNVWEPKHYGTSWSLLSIAQQSPHLWVPWWSSGRPR
jgi:hypothetical protein